MLTCLSHLVIVSILFRLADAGYCTQSINCYRECSTKTSYHTACGLFNWQRCTRYRTKYYTCTNTCYRQACCSGYTGRYCESPMCYGSTTCQNDGICLSPDVCKCIAGFSTTNCADIDECAINTHGCQHGCVNTLGSFECTCRKGYTLDSDLKSCIDVNPCITNHGGCSQTCTNTEGSFQCGCFDGYSLEIDGVSCIDIDECQMETPPCSQGCLNLPGSYQCSCDNGYLLDIDDKTCIDIDECTDGSATCRTYCLNTEGSYNCSCNAGYIIDEENRCRDIDECLEDDGPCDQICVNKPGSFHCECSSGYQLTGSSECLDIDECTDGISGCSDGCMNQEGSYTCTCPSGDYLLENNKTCNEIDDCLDVVCQHGGICSDGIDSFTCSCTTGYTDTFCETDTDECATFNGGCQDKCTNTMGSFICSCFDDRDLNDDGVSCKGDGYATTVFEKHSISGQLLPKPCFEVLLTRCNEGRDLEIVLASTSEWYTLLTDLSVVYTFGIVFVRANTLTVPVSLHGIEVSMAGNSFELRHTVRFNITEGILKVSNSTSPDCQAFAFVESDMFDFISADSFTKTLHMSLFSQLPSWLEFSKSNHSTISVQDMQSDIIYGRNMDTAMECSGAPVIDSHLYSVFRFNTGFSLTILGNKIDLPSLLEARKFCIIADICENSGGTVFLMIPEESRGLLLELPVFVSLKNDLNLQIKPRGIGLSFVDGITVDYDQNSMTLWNGDHMFQYPVIQYADFWVGGDVEMNDDYFTVQGSVDMFFNIPSVETIVSSMFRDEWNGLIDVRVSAAPIFRFRLFEVDHEITFTLAKADVDVYVSTGGSNRNWCGMNSNPAGLYFSLLLEVNPFMDIPILGEWLFVNNHRLYGFASKDPQHISATVNYFSDEIFEISSIVNNTLSTIETLLTDLEASGYNATSSLLKSITDRLRLIQEIVDIDLNNYWVNVDVNNIISSAERLIEVSTDVKHSLKQFIQEVEFIASESSDALVDTLNTAIEQIQNCITNTLNSITDSIAKEIGEYTYVGLKYYTDLLIFGLSFPAVDIELVFSEGNLFQCSRFDHIAKFLDDEKANRVIGRFSTKAELGFFLGVESGFGFGGALAQNSKKMILQMELFVGILGIRVTADVFVTSGGGLYLYLEGNVWDVFLAQIDVSAELGKEWFALTFVVEGRFVAKARKKRQIQTRSETFQSSYVDALKKVVRSISDDAQKRLTGAQNGLTKAQEGLTKAQIWLDEKKEDIRKANHAFDNAISALETKKQELEEAKAPYENAVKKLKVAQINIDNLCRIRNCPRICIPGMRCTLCHRRVWGFRISYPCCSFVCWFSFPEPLCVLANLVCNAIRAIAYAALEAAVIILRLAMLAYDIAKAAVTVAQTGVDISRGTLKVAEGILVFAQAGLEFAKDTLETAKIALEAVKLVIGAAANVLELVLQFGLQNLLDVRNCGFRVELSTKDLPVFDVSCEVNAFRLGWKKIQLTINFKNILQSIWQAARETITALMKTLSDAFGRKRRNIEFEATSKLHRLLRIIRQTDGSEGLSLNDTVNITKNASAFNMSEEYDAADRIRTYEEKCQTIEKLQNFLRFAFRSLQDTVNDSMAYLDEVDLVKGELLRFNATETNGENITAEDIGISKEYAAKDYNLTDEDIEMAMEDTKSSFNNDPVILQIKNAANTSLHYVELETKTIESIDFVNNWYTAMDNLTRDYFSEIECSGFRDCMFFTITSFYVLYEAEDFPNVTAMRDSILNLESMVIESFQNETSTIKDTAISMEYIVNEIDHITDMNPFCSEAPTINEHPSNVTVLLGTDVKFHCLAVGNPEPQYWWYENDSLIPEERTWTITVQNVSEADNGTKMNCVVGNIVANITSKDAFLLTADYDVDECERDNGDCDHGCVNTVGSYVCICPDGYTINETDGHSCLDKNECLGTFDTVRCEHVCSNFIGGYNCSCYEGYSLDSDGHSCNDIEECDIDNGGCDYQCVNHDGSYQCICYEGHIGSGIFGQCMDVNECDTNNNKCEQNCSNTDGSYSCECEIGYSVDIDGHHCNDIDECDEDNAGCEHLCANTDGSFNCLCSSGYVLKQDLHQCLDIDECEVNNGGCGHQCKNTHGSYLCECNKGFKLDSGGFDCEDMDECSKDNGGCSQLCENTLGSYQCQCEAGYTLGSDDRVCQDIDECSINNRMCHHECVNTIGSYNCRCKPNYVLQRTGFICLGRTEKSFQTSVTMDLAVVTKTRNKRSGTFTTETVIQSLEEFYNNYTSIDVAIVVQLMRLTKSIGEINYTVVYDKSDLVNLVKATVKLCSGTKINYDGVPVDSRSYMPKNDTNECYIFETLFEGCSEGQRCEVTEDGPTCFFRTNVDETTSSNYLVYILPAVGLITICVVVAFVVLLVLRIRKKGIFRIRKKEVVSSQDHQTE